MNEAFGDVTQIVGVLVGGCVLYLLAHAMSKGAAKGKAYFWSLIGAAILGWMAHGNLGTHREDDDPLFGGGQVVEDFDPTPEQRSYAGWRVFFISLIAFSIGVSRSEGPSRKLEDGE